MATLSKWFMGTGDANRSAQKWSNFITSSVQSRFLTFTDYIRLDTDMLIIF